MPRLTALTADTSLASTDIMYTVKASGSSRNKKVTMSTLVDYMRETGPVFDVRRYASINAAVTAIGSTEGTLLVPNAQTLTGNLTVPSTLGVQIQKGGSITKASTYTPTFNGPFMADPYTVFFGFDPGDITFGYPIPAIYPQWWGAVVGSATDSGNAIRCACAATSTYAKRVIFPPGVYRVYTVGTTYTFLGTWTGYTGLEILGYGAHLQIDPARVWTASYGTAFSFSNCHNIKLDGFLTTGPTNDVSSSTGKGLEFARFYAGCTNIEIPVLDIRNWLAAVILSNGSSPVTPDDEADWIADAVKNVHIGELKVTNCWYGFHAQYSGFGVTINNLKTDGVHRSFFIYGTKDVKAHIRAKDAYADDCLIKTYQGYGNEDFRIYYECGTDTQTSNDGCSRVSIQWGDQSPAAIRNGKIYMDSRFNATGETGGTALKISKYNNAGAADTSDRGHTLENITFSGFIQGTPHVAAVLMTTNSDCEWGTGDYWKNITFKDLIIDSSIGSLFDLGALQGPLLLQNVISNQDILLRSTNAIGARPPFTGQYEIINCDIPNLYTHATLLGNVLLLIAPFGTTPTIYNGWTGHIITNEATGGNAVYALPASVVGKWFTFVRSAAGLVDLDPNLTEVIRGGGEGKFLRLAAQGDSVTLRCFTAGTWEVVSAIGIYAFEA